VQANKDTVFIQGKFRNPTLLRSAAKKKKLSLALRDKVNLTHGVQSQKKVTARNILHAHKGKKVGTRQKNSHRIRKAMGVRKGPNSFRILQKKQTEDYSCAVELLTSKDIIAFSLPKGREKKLGTLADLKNI